ncbi:methylenetetrahydrofolate reductase [NAD(P)H] [Leptothoe spongobia]|uniref:Methylenetetrahydrofolate reductase n=1 Tax=Leptothoe spongobia TAU-MAC 1115 TaxID=1967444 RepID=A0A947DIT1_9CYAN|nr:methylenetetrahydrofolate reductase [NAD(P)H] [Leptothoe spongobia]MBT9317717.1 methylenetetrahydrofolate reductase [NAD(P)H] [Leptothoe spongobia TAU-MAC 1115]
MTTLPISFEFFPPKTAEGVDKLMEQHAILAACQPEFFSITYGAGGTTRDLTQKLVLDINAKGIPAVPHLSCIGDTHESLQALLTTYKNAGIDKIVTLRGDLPKDIDDVANEFHYANELVTFIRQHHGDTFTLVVAAYPEVHPEAKNAQQDLINFKRKVEAGASAAITQYFYNADAYEDFVNRCRQQGITIPIYPGIMPITNHERLARFSRMCGAEIPRWIEKRLLDYQNEPASLQAFGLEVVTKLCQKLITLEAPGFHFYSLNQATPTLNILQNLRF